MSLPRVTVALTLTDEEITRLDELCREQGDVPRDTILLRALVVLDKFFSNQETSVFERRAQ